MTDTMQRVYGIDLGTTYSCIAYVDEYGKPVVVPNADNERITPSVVFFDGDNIIVGGVAKENAKLHPEAVVEMVKRSMGDSNFLFEHNGKTYRPEEISSFILKKLVTDAEQVTGDKITDVVITCPAWFGINQKEATANAGKIAGLNVRDIINEPTAAAIAYGMDKGKDQTVLVYDLGGGTFDVTMIEVKEAKITVLGTGGDHNLGGKDWDAAIVDYLVSEFQEQAGSSEDILEDLETRQDLFNQAERAKKTLSQRDKAPLAVTHGGQRVKVELTREKFDELTARLLDSTVELTRKMLAEAALKGYTQFDKVLLVGGSTRMPQVMKRLKEEFGADCEMYDPDEAVAKGASLYGWTLTLQGAVEKKLETLGDGKPDGQVTEEEKQKAADDVARQYKLKPSVVKKAVDTEIVNVTSKTFGVVAVDMENQEIVVNLIRRNDPVPKDVTRSDFGTVEPDQRTVEVRLMENLELAPTAGVAQSTELGRAELRDLPPGLPAGAPIEITFRLHGSGRLEVLAREPSSDTKIETTIETESIMSAAEVEQAKSKALALKVS